jgi:hypothetical protein
MDSEFRLSGPKVLLKNSTSYSYLNGYFGVVDKNAITWYGCRETFHTRIDPVKLREYYYVNNMENAGATAARAGSATSTDVAHFMYKIEKHLDVEKSNFMFTDNKTVMWVSASPWWVENPMRHAFFTVALRAALKWDRTKSTNWKEVLLSHPYANETREAVERFLEGNTEYTGNVRGWKRQFSLADRHLIPNQETDIIKLLKLPEEEKNKRISKIAYGTWEKLGKPYGKCIEIWEKAAQKYAVPEKERRKMIEKIAYHKWEDAGRPHGKDKEFWKEAECDFYVA